MVANDGAMEAMSDRPGMGSERNICLTGGTGQAVEDQKIEIVERKGVGHPDSICDGVAERVAQVLAQAYLDWFGTVLHFNTDETQLVAGSANPDFGGGTMLEPVHLLIVGRATKEYDGQQFPAERIALDAAREYLDETFPHLDVGSDIVIEVRLGEGSGDLQDVFGNRNSVPMANDTSYGVGFAPLTETERIVSEIERELTRRYRREEPAIGRDVKVMAKREGNHVVVTVAVAIVDRFVDSMAEYREVLARVEEYATDVAAEYTDREVIVHVNTADDYDEGSIYLTTTGTSAEQGDDGSVGRGNRVNGLITPNRPMSMEASSGKNPVNHVGKIYNVLSTEIARSIVASVDGVRQAEIRLVSQIGQPIDCPQIAETNLHTETGVAVDDVADDVRAIIDRKLANVTDVTRRLIDGQIATF